MGELSIEAKQNVYLRYRSYPYKWPQVFAEFIDNAIQSFEDNKDLLRVEDPNYKLRVDIVFDWESSAEDGEKKAKSVTISDNAGGMPEERFKIALNLADDSMMRSGMNEFGIGMKAAAAWLGNNWHIETKSLTDDKTLVVDVDITDVCKRDLRRLPYKETIEPARKNGTSITLSDFGKRGFYLSRMSRLSLRIFQVSIAVFFVKKKSYFMSKIRSSPLTNIQFWLPHPIRNF